MDDLIQESRLGDGRLLSIYKVEGMRVHHTCFSRDVSGLLMRDRGTSTCAGSMLLWHAHTLHFMSSCFSS